MIIALKKKKPFSNSEDSESDFNFVETEARFPASHSYLCIVHIYYFVIYSD